MGRVRPAEAGGTSHMNAAELARLLNQTCRQCRGKGCKVCERSGRAVPPSQVEAELRAWLGPITAADEADVLKACRSIRRRRRTVLSAD